MPFYAVKTPLLDPDATTVELGEREAEYLLEVGAIGLLSAAEQAVLEGNAAEPKAPAPSGSKKPAGKTE